jgi:hypothetical protein
VWSAVCYGFCVGVWVCDRAAGVAAPMGGVRAGSNQAIVHVMNFAPPVVLGLRGKGRCARLVVNVGVALLFIFGVGD